MNFSLLFDDPAEYAERPARYSRRFAAMETLAAERGIDIDSMDLSLAERLWAEVQA